VVAAGVVTAVADAATKADEPETEHIAGPERIVKAPSGPLLCPMSAVASAHGSGCPAAQRSSANRALPTVVEALALPATVGDKIESLRQWASGRRWSAERAGVYSRSEEGNGGRGRRVAREPGVN